MCDKRLTDSDIESLYSDIARRLELRRYLLERSLDILGERFGVSGVTIHNAEKRMSSTMHPDDYNQIIVARCEYWKAKHEMQNYTLPALARKHGITAKTVCHYQALYHERRFKERFAA